SFMLKMKYVIQCSLLSYQVFLPIESIKMKKYIVGDLMLYCPKCGTQIKEDESYCINIKCGNAIPGDMMERVNNKKTVSKWWILPAMSIVTVTITIGIFAYMLQQKD